jgi:hypothetical protein
VGDDGVEGEDFGDFVFGCTIESDPKRCEESKDIGVGITFDSVKGLDTGKVSLPSEKLAVDFSQVCDEKGIFDVGVAIHFETCLLLLERLETATELISDSFAAMTCVHVDFGEAVMWKWIFHFVGHVAADKRVDGSLFV